MSRSSLLVWGQEAYLMKGSYQLYPGIQLVMEESDLNRLQDHVMGELPDLLCSNGCLQ